MKALLLSVFCALVMNVQAMEIKKDTIDQYIIDKKVIERFDGTQLEGKTILKYIIAYKDAGNTVQKKHVIVTDSKNLSFGGKPVKQMKYEGLIIVDGKEAEGNDISYIKADEIVNMEIYKAGSKVANSYGEKGKNGVMRIITKSNTLPANIYFLDGRRVEKSVIDKLSPSKIVSIGINEKEGKSVVEVVTKK